MTKKPVKDKQVDGGQPKRVLGEVPGGSFDTELSPRPANTGEVKADPEAVPGLAGLRKKESGAKAALPSEAPQAGQGTPTPGSSDERLVLPHSGLVAMRRSGGLRFTSSEVIVYIDGHITTSNRVVPGSPPPQPVRNLSDKELAELYRALDKANLPELPASTGRQNPDAYAYELVARLGTETYSLEVFDGSIPPQADTLIRMLTRYMRPQH